MKINSISRASVALAGAAAMVVVGAGATAIAQEADGDTGSLTVNGSGVHTNSLASPQYSAATDPLDFSYWEECDIEKSTAIGLGTFGGCQEVIVRGGEMNIGDLNVPIPDGSLKISGGSRPFLNDIGFPTGESEFVPALNSEYGVFQRELPVPGGALGSANFINLTDASASVEAVGMPDLRALELAIDMPVRIKMENPLLGDSCYIGSEEDPIMLNIRPDSGGQTIGINERYQDFGGTVPGIMVEGAVGSDHDFAVPAAQGCGLGGSLNWLVNWRANSPSPAGENSITVEFDAMDAGVTMITDWRDNLE